MAAGRAVRVVGVAVFLLVCLAQISLAQTGAITGVARDATGAVLPGVTVEAASPALIEKVRTTVTDTQGLYRIIDLRPGVYSLTFTLPGFNSLKRDDLELSAGFTATVNAELRVGAVEETITVTGQTPLVDVQNVSQQRVMDRVVLDSLPTGRTIQNAAVLVPGVAARTTVGVNSQDVGGSVGERIQNLSVHGSRSQAPTLWNGLRYNSMNGSDAGTSNITPNPGSIQEITVEVGGLGAEAEVSGVRLNVVPKDGGNLFSGFFTAAFTNDALESSNVDAELKAQGILDLNYVDKIWDFNPAMGGPIKKDRLWFYTSFRSSGSNVRPPNAFYSVNPLAFVYTPDRSRPAVEDNDIKNAEFRLTWQVSPRNKASVFFDKQWRCHCHFGASATRAPEASYRYVADDTWLGQATWNFAVTSKVLLETGVSLTRDAWCLCPQPELQSQPGVTNDAYSVTELRTGMISGAFTNYTHQNNLQGSSKVTLHYVTGSHAFRVGMQTMNGFREFGPYWANGDINLFSLDGLPSQVVVRATPYTQVERMQANVSLFAQDQWKVKRMTLTGGVRFDYFNSYVPEQHLPAARYVGARDFAPLYDVPNWKDISPRMGVAYDLFGDGRTAVKASLNRFVQGMVMGLAGANNPVVTSVLTATRSWFDLNGDLRAQENELGPVTDQNFGRLNPAATRYSDDVLRGWGKRPSDWEASLGIQRELGSGISATASWNRHWYNHKYAVDNLAVTPADYDEYCITAPVDPRLPSSGQRLCGLYDITPTMFGRSENLVTFADNYGKQEEVYTGVDLSINMRLPRGVVVQGGTSTGRVRLNDCFVIDSPGAFASNVTTAVNSRLRYCDITPPYQTFVKLLGVYPLPWDTVASVTYQFVPGPEITANYTVSSAEIAPSLGRPLAGAARTATVPLVEPGTMYGDYVNQIDLRLAKNILLGRLRIQPQVDFYNLLNANPVLNLNTNYGPAWQNATYFLTGRLIKFGVQMTF